MSQKEEQERHEHERRSLWMQVAVAVAACDSTLDRSAPARWADQVLKAFDERFPGPQTPAPEKP